MSSPKRFDYNTKPSGIINSNRQKSTTNNAKEYLPVRLKSF
ncbi:MAG: hypothetical protein ACR2IA_07840 [Pyrinomonadaceae bacterium]